MMPEKKQRPSGARKDEVVTRPSGARKDEVVTHHPPQAPPRMVTRLLTTLGPSLWNVFYCPHRCSPDVNMPCGGWISVA
jgi:hypothetical protein